MNKRGIVKVLLVLLLFGGALALTMYPFIANYLFENKTDSVVNSIEQSAQDIDDSEQKAAIEAAKKYNQTIANGHVQLKDPFDDEQLEQEAGEYNSLLNLTDDGVMGTIEIPSINVSLPIYHGTDNTILQIGVGHIEGSSLPVGGPSTHCAISGHRGLTSSKLFTDIDQMAEGDIFKLYILGETMTYEVDQIRIVLPDELNDLKIEEGQDYCTLITCTPYGVNSHRLLIRGHRIANDAQGLVVEDAKQIQPLHEAIILGVVFLVLYIIICKILNKTILYRFR